MRPNPFEDYDFKRIYNFTNDHSVVVYSKSDFSWNDGLAFVRQWRERNPNLTSGETSEIVYEAPDEGLRC